MSIKSKRKKEPSVVSASADRGTCSAPLAPLKWDRAEVPFLIFVTILGFALRFYRLSSKSMWIDEFVTYNNAMDIWKKDFWLRTHILSFIMVRLSLLFGYKEFSLRLPSFLFGFLSVPAIYIMIKRWFEKREIALFGSLMTALSLYQIYFSQEARYYTEVTFFSVVSLYLFYRLLWEPRIWVLTSLVLVTIVNFGIHPTSGVLFGAQFLFGYIFFFVNEKYNILGEWRRKCFSRPGTRILQIAFLGLGLLALGIGWRYLFRGFVMQILRRLAQVPHIPLTRGVGLNIFFFLSPITHFSFIYGTPTANWGGYVFSFFFFWGLVQGFKHYRWQTVFVIWAYFMTFVALFLFKADIPYTEKYVIYLYPLYISSASIGFLSFFEGLLSHCKGIGVSRTSLACALFTLLLLHLAQWRDYYMFYTYETQPYRSALNIIREKGEKVGTLIITGHGYSGFRYYAPQYGINPDKIQILDIGPNDSLTLKRSLRSTESVWFCPLFGFGEQYDKPAFKRIKSFFRLVGTAHSSFSSHWDIPVYRFFPGRVMYADVQNCIPVSFSNRQARNPSNNPVEMKQSSSGRWRGEDSFTIMDPATYTIQIQGPPEIIRSFRFHCEMGDIRTTDSTPVAFPKGQATLTLLYDGQKPADDPSLKICWHTIKPFIYAIYYDFTGPIGKFTSLFVQNKGCLAILKNGFVSYSIHAPEKGNYLFEVEALNDKPRAVFVEVAVNEKPLGVLAYSDANDLFSTKSFEATLDQGTNILTFYFLNDQSDRTSDLSENNTDFIFRRFMFESANEAAEVKSDLLRSGDFVRADFDASFFSQSDPQKLNPFWRVKGKALLWGVLENGKKMLHIEIPYDLKGFILFSKSVPVEAGEILYCSLRMKCNQMANHSANIMFTYLDDRNQTVGREWVYPTGISGDKDWLRFPCLRLMGPNVRSVVVMVQIYQNGQHPGKKKEHLWLSDFRFLPDNAESGK